MTKLKNIALAKRIIRKDCMISGNNIDDDGNTCVVGALGLASGMKKGEMSSNHMGGGIGEYWNESLLKLITKKFGMTEYELIKMQHANDRAKTIPIRRKAVLAALDRIIKLRKLRKQATKGSKCK